MDPDEAMARARKHHREAGLHAAVSQLAREWWDQLDEQNGFRARWEQVTGR